MSNSIDTADKLFHLAFLLHNKLMRPVINRSRYDLSPLQLHLLATLEETEAITMTMLASYIRISKQQLTRLVDTLVSQGFASREFDSRDRRIIKISITETGRILLENIKQESCLAMSQELTVFNSNEMAELYKNAATLSKLLDKLP